MKNVYDLEDAIMKAWSTADDIGLIVNIIEAAETLDAKEILPALKGIQHLHDLRGNVLFSQYERVCFSNPWSSATEETITSPNKEVKS